MKVSVIVPCYNCEKTLVRCLKSLINQEYRDIEIILINDGSTDNTGKICDEYNNKYGNIKAYHINNGGPSNARNIGINNASGDIVTFVDSDDYIDKHMYSDMLQEMGDCDMCMCNCYLVDNAKIIKFNHNLGTQTYNAKKILIDGCFYQEIPGINMVYKFYKSSVIRKYNIKYDINYSIGEDLLFNIDYLYHCNKVKMLDNAYYYYVRDNEYSLTYKDKNNLDWEQMFRREREMLSKASCYNLEIDLYRFHYVTLMSLYDYIAKCLDEEKINKVKPIVKSREARHIFKYNTLLPRGIKIFYNLLILFPNLGLYCFYIRAKLKNMRR